MVFADPEVDRRFRADGIVGPFPALEPDASEQLLRRLRPLVPGEAPFYTMHREGDSPARRRQIAEVIAELVEPTLESMLGDYRLFLGGVFFKQAHPESRLGLHQDWTFVDETKLRSGSFWLPLVDATVENGTFHAVVGSHTIERTYRGSPLWPYVATGVMDQLEQDYLTFYEMPAGHALAFDHRLVHGSFPNRTPQPRPAIAVGFLPIDAPIHHYYLASDGRQYRYTVDDEFFFDYVIGEPPAGPHVLDCEEISVPIYMLDRDAVLAEFVATGHAPPHA